MLIERYRGGYAGTAVAILAVDSTAASAPDHGPLEMIEALVTRGRFLSEHPTRSEHD